MRLYSELADWFHRLTAPEDYAEEAAAIVQLAEATGDGELRTLLELGSGGGECEHVAGDMRTLRLSRSSFSRKDWLAWLRDAGSGPTAERVVVEDGAPGWTAFVARRPVGPA